MRPLAAPQTKTLPLLPVHAATYERPLNVLTVSWLALLTALTWQEDAPLAVRLPSALLPISDGMKPVSVQVSEEVKRIGWPAVVQTAAHAGSGADDGDGDGDELTLGDGDDITLLGGGDGATTLNGAGGGGGGVTLIGASQTSG